MCSRSKIVGEIDKCPHCGVEPCQVYEDDIGIGSYEYWGQKCHDSRIVYCCVACDEQLDNYEPDDDYEEREPEYHEDDL